MRRWEGATVIVRLFVSLIGTVAIFGALLDRISRTDATYFLAVAIFLLVMELSLNREDRRGPKGDTGPMGPEGPPGPMGMAGRDA